MTLLEMLSPVVALAPGKGNQGADMQEKAGSLCYIRAGTAKPLQFSLMDNQGAAVCRLFQFFLTIKHSKHISGKERENILTPE